MKTTAQDIIDYMESLHDEEQRLQLMRFFKTGKGDYGEGDEFLGLKVPQTREVVKHAKDLPLEEIPTLLVNRYHEVRLCGFLLLVNRFEKLCTKKLINDKVAIEKRDEIVSMYLEYADYANNWDLVDLSAPKIIGRWLMVPTGWQACSKTASSRNITIPTATFSPMAKKATEPSSRGHFSSLPNMQQKWPR